MADGAGGAFRLALWHLVAFLAVLLLPLHYRAGIPFWTAPPPIMVQALVGAVGYLMAALATSRQPRRSRALRALGAASLALASFALLALLPRVFPELPVSRALLGLAFALSLVLIVVPELPRLVSIGGTLALSALLLATFVRVGGADGAPEIYTVDTQFYLLSVGVSADSILEADAEIEGGGLAPLGSDLLWVSGTGRFARLRTQGEGAFTVEPLSLPSPANRDEFLRDVTGPVMTGQFRVVDLVAEQNADSVVLFVSHHQWMPAARCYVLRVSVASGHDDLRRWTPWQPLFDAEPCLEIGQGSRGVPFSGAASGGRMVLLPEGLLLTVGDHLHDGLNFAASLPRDSTSHYGKTVLIRPDGSSEIFTSGHRNPQGLARDSAGRFWSTEHGPQGGDELNLLERGADYGWPQRSLGTEYGLRAWPLQEAPSPQLREPVFALVPSVGISNLIAVSDPAFSDWRGDLLIGSLRGRKLLRVRLDRDRPVYVEEIPLGYEVRDLEETGNGTIVVWTDERRLLSIAPDDSDRSGAAIASRCAGCHTLNEGQTGGIGPNLWQLVGRRVATAPGFAYSEAMASLGGRWTPERLDAFLADPAGFAPGNAMSFTGIRDPEQRRLLVDYLAASGSRPTGPP